jgi:succinyl-CoA synthetase alpha subunit
MLQSQSKSRLVGANAPGIISAIGRCRIGFQPLPTFSPGHIGIVAKSGTLSYETVGSLTRAGLGQSLCIAVGGDVVAGTNFVDALKVFEHDENTEAIILVGELGGTSEEEAADWIRDYKKRVKNPKPIAAAIGGFQASPGKVMGHAGAWTGLGEGTAESKYKALEDVGVTMVDHPAKFGGVMKEILSESGRNVKKIVSLSREFQLRILTGQRNNQRPPRNNDALIILCEDQLDLQLLQPLIACPSRGDHFTCRLNKPMTSLQATISTSLNRLRIQPPITI